MQRYSRGLALLGCSIFAFLATARALAADVIVGADLVNEPHKQSISEQENTFRVLQAAGEHVIRAGIPGNDQGIDFAQRAYAHGCPGITGQPSRSSSSARASVDPVYAAAR